MLVLVFGGSMVLGESEGEREPAWAAAPMPSPLRPAQALPMLLDVGRGSRCRGAAEEPVCSTDGENKVLLLVSNHAARLENMIGFAVLPIPPSDAQPLLLVPGASRLLQSCRSPKDAAGLGPVNTTRAALCRAPLFCQGYFIRPGLEKLLIPLNCPFRGFFRRQRLD